LDVEILYPDKQTSVDSNEERLVVEDKKENALKAVPPSDATVNKHLEAGSRTETQHTSCKRTAETPKVRRNKKQKQPSVESNEERIVSQGVPPSDNTVNKDVEARSQTESETTIKSSLFRRKSPRNTKQAEQMLLNSFFGTVMPKNAALSAKPKSQTIAKKKTVQQSKKKKPQRKRGVCKTSRCVDNMQEAESSDSDFGSRRELLPDDFSLLPKWVVVPFHDWISRSVTVSKPMKSFDLKVVPTKGDGNCFYYCICQSRIFQTKFPAVMDNVMEIREHIHAYATENPEYGKLLHESNFFDIDYEKWLQ
jgi:hypothetical protein